MIELKMITDDKDILKETGLPSRDKLWDAGFDLDDWDVCFVSNVRLTEPCDEYDEDGFPIWEPEPIDDAYWLVRQMEYYSCGYKEVECNGKWYYMAYHS